MQKVILSLVLFLGLCTLLPSCYFDNEQDLYPFLKCDTTNITYSITIAPIMSSNCNVCHSPFNVNGNTITSTWEGLNTVALSGKLMPSVDHTGPFPMPKTGTMLSDCDIQKIRIWVSKGALNN